MTIYLPDNDRANMGLTHGYLSDLPLVALRNVSLKKGHDHDVKPQAEEAIITAFYNESVKNHTDDYSYDYEESVNSLPYDELIPVSIVYVVTLVLGLTGNLFVVFSIVRYRRMQTVTNVFLTSLATADLLLVLLCIPIKLAKFYTFTWTFGAFLCKLVHYLQNISVICSILTLTALSLERYYAILNPMKAKYVCTLQRAKRLISILWIMSFLLAGPILYGQIQKEVGWKRKGYWCVKEWPARWHSQLYEFSMLVVIFVLPLAIISFAYISICREMMHMTSKRAMMRRILETGTDVDDVPTRKRLCRANGAVTRRVRPMKDDLKTRKQVINMLVAIIILFAICWGPILIDNVLVSFGILDKYHYGYLRPMRIAFSLMSYANSCVNPVVYALMSKNFRTSFQNTWSVLTRRRRLDSITALLRQSSLISKPPSGSCPLSPFETSIMLPQADERADGKLDYLSTKRRGSHCGCRRGSELVAGQWKDIV